MSAHGWWLMFSLWMYSGNHYIVGTIALVLSFLIDYLNRREGM